MADALAKEGSKLVKENIFLWMEVLPVYVTSVLEVDKGKTFFVRTKKYTSNPDFVIVSINNSPPPPKKKLMADTATSV